MLDQPASTPAEGERRAIGGFYPQYRVSAFLILRALREASLRWIRVADPQAGRVDDLQIGSDSRIDAYQVKWSRYGELFHFRQLVQPSGSSPGLIAQLADGWRRLKALHTGHRVVVHLISNKTPSSSGRVISGDPAPTAAHTAAFIEQVWNQLKRTPPEAPWAPPPAWRPAWDQLQTASGLSPADFRALVSDCELELSYRLPELDAPLTRDEQILRQDIEHLTHELFATVAEPAQIIELTRDQLLGRLGWRRRTEFRSRHEFPIERALYEPIGPTVQQLHRALDSLVDGYIAVLGSPGSGKSTLLTDTLRARPERVVRYYAYVPDAQDPLQLRGESESFLHDVVLALERAGFRVGETLSLFNREQLLDRLHAQFRLLHEDWLRTGQKTILLVDGLDHITRELRPQRSLLQDLPEPEQVPPGVLIVLGSQTVQLDGLPDRVQHAIRQAERRIEMRPLSRDAVFRIIDRASFPLPLTDQQKDDVYRLSGGHPLALGLLINQLRSATDAHQIDQILQGTEPYTGDIEAQYHSYWRQIEEDDELVHLLGMLARLRTAIDLVWVETWASPVVVSRLRRRFAHYFRIESARRWHFFHNSFRLFVVSRTRETTLGVTDASRERAFHSELADCFQASQGRWAWEELYHRVAAEQHELVLQRATPEWFRAQFLALRPADAIQADIRIALRSMAALEDPIALARLNFASAEIGQRHQHLEELPLVELLLALGEVELAVEHARDGNRLRVTPKAGLEISTQFLNAGLTEEARKLFELAEPLDLLASSAPIAEDHQDEKGGLLEAWAAAAIYFHDLQHIIAAIRRLRYLGRTFTENDPEQTTRWLQNRMLYRLGLALLDDQRWGELRRVASEFDLVREDDLDWWFWLLTHAWQDRARAGDWKMARTVLDEKLEKARALPLKGEQRTLMAEGVYRILGNHEHARELLVGVDQPELVTDLPPAQTTFTPFLQRFRLNRLLSVLGDRRTPAELVPLSSGAEHEGLVYFERAICIVARIWGEAWRGRVLDSATIVQEFAPLLRLFHRRWQETEHWMSWYYLQRLRGEFYSLVVNAASQHGPSAIEAISEAFEQLWLDRELSLHWPPDVRRSVLLALAHAGRSRDWITDRLGRLESLMLEEKNVAGRIEECHKQAQARLELRDTTSARLMFEQAIRISLGVGYRKDYQFSDWVYWLSLINEVEPSKARERIVWFAQAVLTLEEITEGEASRLAANELLKAAFKWSPRRGVAVFNFFIERRIIQYEEALGSLLADLLQRPDAPTDLILGAIADFLLPLARHGDGDLVTLLVKETASRRGRAAGLDAARYLVYRADVLALPSVRRKWRRVAVVGLDALGLDFRTVGLTEEDLRYDRQESSPPLGLRLRDGSRLAEEEVLTRATSVEALGSLLEQQADDAYFDWEPIIARIVGTLDVESVLRLEALVATRHRSALTLALLSERLSTLNKTDAAWTLGLQALKASEAWGWSRWADGGSRLAAFRVLVRARKLEARHLAYQTLGRDGGGGAGNLDEILPLLVDKLPVREIWLEVERYVRALFENFALPQDQPENFDITPPHDTPSRAIADLIALHVDHPSRLVAHSSQRTCVELLLRESASMIEALLELLDTSESRQESILPILEAVVGKRPDIVSRFRPIILRLASSPNYAVRMAAQGLCKCLGWELPSLPSAPRLPAIYDLLLPPISPELVANREPRFELPLPDTSNPGKLLSPFTLQLGLIADLARLPKVNVYHRAVQIMRELDRQESWTAAAEGRLRAILDSAGLRFGFRRPRAVLARRAVFHIILELLDAGRLTATQIADLDPVLTFCDPQLLVIAPTSRPPDVLPIPRRERYSERHEQWIERINEVRGVVRTTTDDGRIVLAEHTVLKVLEWEEPTEKRFAVARSAPPSADRDPADRFFHIVLPSLVEHYPALGVRANPPPLVIRNDAYTYDTLGAEWIALDPAVAAQLGWTLKETGLFAWCDEAGETMAETVWWADGSLHHYPPEFDDEVGEGWLVLASPAGVAALKTIFPAILRYVRVERRLTLRDGGEITRHSEWQESVD